MYGNASLGVLLPLVGNVKYARPIVFFSSCQYLPNCVVIALDNLLIDSQFPSSVLKDCLFAYFAYHVVGLC